MTQRKPFRTDVWERRQEAERHRAEELRRATLQAARDVLSAVSDDYRWDEVFLFGSVLRPGGFSRRSDVDVAVAGLDKLLHYRLVADLSSRLERDVDVVLLEECSFAEAIRDRGMRWSKDG